ncbi:phosphatase PAP2 family protein [Neolewinella antarctica]|nr:phosphatase PAP2 family protein [Neolewinella antarctica]
MLIDRLLQSLRALSAYVQRDVRLLRHLSLLLLAGFVVLTLLVLFVPPALFDLGFSLEVQEDQSPVLDAAMHAVSWFGNGIAPGLIPALVALTFLLLGARREALFTLLTLLSGAVIYGIKILIDRPRPTADLIRIIEDAQFQSFPSGHVTFYVTFFGFVVFLMYRLTWVWTWLRWTAAIICLALIFTVPFSRMYLGAHWFTDVAAGFLIGLLCLIVLAGWYASRQDDPAVVTSEVRNNARP